MILVLKAKCIFICSSYCDREWEKSRKDHLSLSFIYDSLSIIGKCKLAFFWTTVCYIKTLKHIKTHIKTDGPWRSSLKCIGGCSERALWWRSGAAQVTAPSRHGTGWIWPSSNCAELPPELFSGLWSQSPVSSDPSHACSLCVRQLPLAGERLQRVN